MQISIRSAARAALQPLSRFRPSRKRLGFALALLIAAAQPLPAHEFEAGDLLIVHPWSRETPHGARVAAGYVKIVNRGPEADRLVDAAAEIGARTEIHEMSVDANGVMTMRPVAGGIEIPAGGEVELKPGGYHIMFMELTDAKKKGERFRGSLTFEKAGTVEVEFAVDAMAGGHNHGG